MPWEGNVVCASDWHEAISLFHTIEICRKSRLWRQHLVVLVSTLRLVVRMSVPIVESCVWLCV